MPLHENTQNTHARMLFNDAVYSSGGIRDRWMNKYEAPGKWHLQRKNVTQKKTCPIAT